MVCLPNPGNHCGGTSSKPQLSEVGTVRGTGHTVWFVQDNERKAKLTGCVMNSQEEGGCGANDRYSMTWKLTPKGLAFQNFVGLGDEAGQAGGYVNFTFQPWTKIS